MTMRLQTIALLLPLVLVVTGSACGADEYPNCGAFEFGDLQQEPRLVDEDVEPDDCGTFRVVGPLGASTIEDPAALDCALEHVASDRPMQVRLEGAVGEADAESAMIFSDGTGLAMRWRSITTGSNTEREARVYELDTRRVAECRESDDAYERFTCLYGEFEAGEIVKTCQTNSSVSQ